MNEFVLEYWIAGVSGIQERIEGSESSGSPGGIRPGRPTVEVLVRWGYYLADV